MRLTRSPDSRRPHHEAAGEWPQAALWTMLETRARQTPERPHELRHAALDAPVDSPADLRPLLHGIFDRPRRARFGIEIAQEDDVPGGPPELLANDATLQGVHDHDQIGRPQELTRDGSRAVGREIDASLGGGEEGVGRRGPTGPHEPCRLDADPA